MRVDSDAPTHVIGIAASAGGLEALRRVVGDLPADLPAAICVVLHIPPTGRSLLAPILDRDGSLHAVSAENGQPLRRGTIYVAPSDRHLLVRRDRVELSAGPKENGVRPAADPLFRSMAGAWGRAAIGIVLSGALGDGSAGAVALASAGGTVIVQDPADAGVPSMPERTIAAISPDHTLPSSDIGALLRQLTREPAAAGAIDPAPRPVDEDEHPPGLPSSFTCPECGGAQWELRDGGLVRYRCRVGHVYSEDAMVQAQGEAVEAALWTALAVLEERSALLGRIADRAQDRPRSAEHWTSAAREAQERAELIRRALAQGIINPVLSEVAE